MSSGAYVLVCTVPHHYVPRTDGRDAHRYLSVAPAHRGRRSDQHRTEPGRPDVELLGGRLTGRLVADIGKQTGAADTCDTEGEPPLFVRWCRRGPRRSAVRWCDDA